MPAINYLKYLRIQKGWTQKKLAEMVGRKPCTLQGYEKGKLKVPEIMSIKLAEFLGIDNPNSLCGYIKKIHLHEQEYYKALPNLPFKRPVIITISDKAYPVMLGMAKRSISLTHCHSLVTPK